MVRLIHQLPEKDTKKNTLKRWKRLVKIQAERRGSKSFLLRGVLAALILIGVIIGSVIAS